MAVFFCRWVPKGEAPSNCTAPPPDSDPEVWRSSLTQSAGTSRPRKLASEVVFCFPALRFDAFSPYRDSRYCCAPKPGKEKHKSDHYRSGILMVHRFRSFLSVFTPVLRKIWREVTRKNQKTDQLAFAEATAWQAADYPPSSRLRRAGSGCHGLESGRRGDLDFGWRPPRRTPYNCHRICNSAVAPCRIFLNDLISVLSVRSSPRRAGCGSIIFRR